MDEPVAGGTPGEQPPARRHRWYLDPEMLVALGALLASLSAVGVSAYEAYLQRRYDRASVWPRLEITSTFGADVVKLELVNSGLGPALVESAMVSVDGQPARDWPTVIQRLTGRAIEAVATSSVRDRAIRAGESVPMLAVATANVSGMPPARLHAVRLRICYASVYGERWELVEGGLGEGGPPPGRRSVRRCPSQPDSILF